MDASSREKIVADNVDFILGEPFYEVLETESMSPSAGRHQRAVNVLYDISTGKLLAVGNIQSLADTPYVTFFKGGYRTGQGIGKAMIIVASTMQHTDRSVQITTTLEKITFLDDQPSILAREILEQSVQAAQIPFSKRHSS